MVRARGLQPSRVVRRGGATFGTDGVAITAFGAGHDYARGLSLQPDGGIIVIGQGSSATVSDFGYGAPGGSADFIAVAAHELVRRERIRDASDRHTARHAAHHAAARENRKPSKYGIFLLVNH